MSAETLRRAAALMRQRAEAATLPPGIKGDTARHVTSWSPTVALAVADLLDATAEHDDTPCPAADRALAVANAYLGEDR